jgi:hypothetical protein
MEVARPPNQQGQRNPALRNVQNGEPILSCQFLKHAYGASAAVSQSAQRLGDDPPAQDAA